MQTATAWVALGPNERERDSLEHLAERAFAVVPHNCEAGEIPRVHCGHDPLGAGVDDHGLEQIPVHLRHRRCRAVRAAVGAVLIARSRGGGVSRGYHLCMRGGDCCRFPSK